jgi:hypothetical protein
LNLKELLTDVMDALIEAQQMQFVIIDFIHGVWTM